ncbi:MAG TPA: hypothetical protein VFE27_24275 [Acidobacteriaceae bacterium]|jgi:hypothetical protein|nr:hypothetical protein [Acidobacteriaceae bacterium]
MAEEEKTQEELKELEKEMRDRSHQLAALLQSHSAELAGIKVIAEGMIDVRAAVYGDMKSGIDTGLRGTVQRLYQEIRDIELRRQQDRKREDEQWSQVIEQNRKQSDDIKRLSGYAERRGGAFGLVRQIGETITVLSVAGGLILALVKLATMR